MTCDTSSREYTAIPCCVMLAPESFLHRGPGCRSDTSRLLDMVAECRSRDVSVSGSAALKCVGFGMRSFVLWCLDAGSWIVPGCPVLLTYASGLYRFSQFPQCCPESAHNKRSREGCRSMNSKDHVSSGIAGTARGFPLAQTQPQRLSPRIPGWTGRNTNAAAGHRCDLRLLQHVQREHARKVHHDH